MAIMTCAMTTGSGVCIARQTGVGYTLFRLPDNDADAYA